MGLYERFWSKVRQTGGCWEWTGTKSRGYGQIWFEGKQRYAHHASWFLTHGVWPSVSRASKTGREKMILHKCDNSACVRPSHLRLGTHLENMQDRMLRGRVARGEALNRKMTESQVLRIRKLAKTGRYTQDRLAKMFGIAQPNISQIILRRVWTHV